MHNTDSRVRASVDAPACKRLWCESETHDFLLRSIHRRTWRDPLQVNREPRRSSLAFLKFILRSLWVNRKIKRQQLQGQGIVFLSCLRSRWEVCICVFIDKVVWLEFSVCVWVGCGVLVATFWHSYGNLICRFLLAKPQRRTKMHMMIYYMQTQHKNGWLEGQIRCILSP